MGTVSFFFGQVNNSNDPDAQMRYLAFNIEHALKVAGESKICKFAIFMHMYDFSLFSAPPFKVGGRAGSWWAGDVMVWIDGKGGWCLTR